MKTFRFIAIIALAAAVILRSGSHAQCTGANILVIDPGHGGSQPGSIGPYLGHMEKDINLQVALLLATFPKNRGLEGLSSCT